MHQALGLRPGPALQNSALREACPRKRNRLRNIPPPRHLSLGVTQINEGCCNSNKNLLTFTRALPKPSKRQIIYCTEDSKSTRPASLSSSTSHIKKSIELGTWRKGGNSIPTLYATAHKSSIVQFAEYDDLVLITFSASGEVSLWALEPYTGEGSVPDPTLIQTVTLARPAY